MARVSRTINAIDAVSESFEGFEFIKDYVWYLNAILLFWLPPYTFFII